MKYEILEHDQTGSHIYDVVDMKFTKDDLENGYFIAINGNKVDIEEFLTYYIDQLSKQNLNDFTTTSYSMQPIKEPT